MPKVVHLIPYDGIGGVETAARSMDCENVDDIDFEVVFIFREVSHAKQRWLTFNPLPLFAAARRVVTGNPDLLIVSLWRSAIVGILARLLRPRLKLVLFIHNATDVHWLDFIFTRMAVHLATEVWADSSTSLQERLPRLNPDKSRVISFVTRHLDALPASAVTPDFIFWGRITSQKGLPGALRIFSEIRNHYRDAQFSIIGPDGGDLCAVQQLCDTLELSDAVFFLGEMSLGEITTHAHNSSFYLQTSLFEGMAMAVVEAMQFGLLPIVTPVGEIATYCRNGDNALIVDADQKVVEEVANLLNDDEKYQSMREKAITTWEAKPLYTEDVLSACRALLNGSNNPLKAPGH